METFLIKLCYNEPIDIDSEFCLNQKFTRGKKCLESPNLGRPSSKKQTLNLE